ncbi:MAG: hypothetical protein PHQ89_02475 [Bacilli bacterium]|nr:hypothetical protein [Bacilli bacterium]
MTNPIEKLFETDGDSTNFFLGQFRETGYAIIALRLNYFYPNNIIKNSRLGKKSYLPFPELLMIDFDRKDLKTVFALNKRDNEIAKLKSPELYERLSKITGKTITSLTLDNLDEIKDIIEAEKLIIALKEQPWKLRALNEQVSAILQYEGANLDQDNYSNSEVDTETHSIRR